MAAAGGATGHAPFPWEAAMHAGLCLLRLAPADFWSLTPREFFVMAGGLRAGRQVMERGRLEALMTAFPD